MVYKHISIDIESWGTDPGDDIRSVGAVVFDPDTAMVIYPPDEFDRPSPILDNSSIFYAACDNPLVGIYSKDHHTQQELDMIGGGYRRYNLRRNADTVQWWYDQEKEHPSQFASAFKNPRDLKDVLLALSFFILELSDNVRDGQALDVLAWSHGAGFDLPMLKPAYDVCGLTYPLYYRAGRDTRTVFDDAGIIDHSALLKKHRYGTLHNALDDAITQARAVTETRQTILEQKLAVKRLNRENKELHYRNTLMLQLLGPKALEYMRLQESRGVAWEHISWGPKAHELTGEERAQFLLDAESLPKTQVDSVDSWLIPEVKDLKE